MPVDPRPSGGPASRTLPLAILLALVLSTGRAVSQPVERTGVPVALVSFAEKVVERSAADGGWSPVQEGVRMRTGERLRTGPSGLARIEFPWMKLSLGPSSVLAIPGGRVLSMVLENGRVEIRSEGDIIKLLAGDVEIRGQGRAVVRQIGGSTLVAAHEGQFRVQRSEDAIALETNEGTIVVAGQAPSPPEPLPEPPGTVNPGSDPTYVRQGEPFQLSWEPKAGKHHVQILGINSDVILIEKDVGGAPEYFAIPWLGTFRWRVSAQDAQGLEGIPSVEGLVCVVEK